MKVDPTSSEWDETPRRPRHVANVDPVALTALVLEIGSLRCLARWPPVGQLVESLKETASGDGGMTRHEVDRLRYWARRWRKLTPRLRRFYREALRTLAYDIDHGTDRKHEQAALNKALWHVFEGWELPGWAYGRVLSLFDELEGGRPDFELVPRGRRSPTSVPLRTPRR